MSDELGAGALARGVAGRRRPPRRPWHAAADLEDFAIVTWACAPERLAAILPPGFEPELFDGGEAIGQVSLVSTVSHLDRDFRFRGAPFVRMTCGQVDHRAYVMHQGDSGVWFVGTSLDHVLVRIATALWSMPWDRETVTIDATWDDGLCRAMRVDAPGPWGSVSLDLSGANGTDAPALVRSPLVTDPLLAWYARRDGGVGRFSVWHPPLHLQSMQVRSAASQPFVDLGVLDHDQAAIGALVARSVAFDVHTPPRRLR
jgi:hypothetical protein